jgi:hypothetical protein
LSETLGIDGLVVGSPLTPAYGSISRFSNRIVTSNFNTNQQTGYSTPFSSMNVLLSFSGPSDPNIPTTPAPFTTPAPSKGSSDEGLSAGDGLLIAVSCLLAVYILGGVIINHRAGATGWDLMPNRSFWSSLPGLIKDGFRFAFIDFFGYRGVSVAPQGSYQPLQ